MDVEKLLKQLKPLYGKQIDKLWIEYQIADEKERRDIKELLMHMAAKKFEAGIGEERIILEPPPKDLISEGEYKVGKVIYPGIKSYNFCLLRDEMLRHIFILGPTGTGKSTLIIGLLLQLLKDRKPFMIFDFKRNYRCLLTSEFGKEMLVLTVGSDVAPLHFNVLQPPEGIPFEEWVEKVSDIICSAYLLMQGARNVLKDALMKAYKTKKEKATFKDAFVLLDTELKRRKPWGRRYGWLESSARSLEELSKGSFGKCLNAIKGLSIASLLSKPVVFELEGLGTDQKKFFCLFFLQAVLLVRKRQQLKREVFRHALVFDESHNIFPKAKYGEIDIPSLLSREIREYGEGIIAATQQSDVSESLIANSGFKFVLRCDHPKDVYFASRLMQLDQKWFPKIQLGFGIVRMPVRHYTPFLFTFEKKEIKNVTVTDEEVGKRWKKFSYDFIPCKSTNGNDVVSEREFVLLKDILDYPISKITERYKRLGWSFEIGNRVKDKVIAKGLGSFSSVKIPTGRVKILSLSLIGLAFLRDKGYEVQWLRHGGAGHEYWKHTLKKKYEKQGYKVEKEYPIGGGKTVDLYAERKGEQLFIEVETGKSNIMDNFEKCKALPGKIIFFFTSKKIKEKYKHLNDEGVTCLDPCDL